MLTLTLTLTRCLQGTLSGLAMDASSGIGFAVGAGHAVCWSDDGGQTWTPHPESQLDGVSHLLAVAEWGSHGAANGANHKRVSGAGSLPLLEVAVRARAGVGGAGPRVPRSVCGVHHMERRTRRAVLSSGLGLELG